MTQDRRLAVEDDGGILRVQLSRPEVHNAFDDVLISEAIELFGDVSAFDSVRAVVLSGSGPSFCAGADLNWMSRMVEWTREENAADSSRLARMFALIDRCPVPVIGRIQGAAIGGGVGLVSVCDIAIASAETKFGLSEVKLGILPAVISPYVINKIGASHARALFLTGERFGAQRALQIGLIHEIADDAAALDAAVERAVALIRSSGPGAVRECKRLIEFVSTHSVEESVPYTIEAIAERRISVEGQEGMRAFLRKEKAPWL